MFLDQTNNEKTAQQSKEQKLSQSLSQTLDQLNRKEDECEQAQRRIKEIQAEKEALQESVRDLAA